MFRFRVNIWEKLGNLCVGFRCNFMVVMRLIRMILWWMSFWRRIWDLDLVKWCLQWIRNSSVVDLSLEYECTWQLGIINWFIIELSIIRYFLGISLRLNRYIDWGVNWWVIAWVELNICVYVFKYNKFKDYIRMDVKDYNSRISVFSKL